MNCHGQFPHGVAVLICVLAVLILGPNSAARAAPFSLCDMRLRVEPSPEAPDPHDPGFLSSLLGDHVDYRLTLQRQDPESASFFTLDLTGPGPEAACRDVVDSMRRDARVVSVEVERDTAGVVVPLDTGSLVGGAGAIGTGQPMGTLRSEPDGDWLLEPLDGVSYAQVAQDRCECDIWAVDQTGFDPTADGGLPPASGKRLDFLRAEGACFQARGYLLK